ncbi:hypothetical protein AX15_000218 [Amanita polypyramis BW_CC]|nr:hypothetical protein AX15_000218 [Amanita polypyramis BW_CC]
MRFAVTVVSLICALTAVTPALAQRDEFSDLAARDSANANSELERRQFFDIAKLAFKGGKALGHLIAKHRHRHNKRSLLDPREERAHLLQLRGLLDHQKRDVESLLEFNARELRERGINADLGQLD